MIKKMYKNIYIDVLVNRKDIFQVTNENYPYIVMEIRNFAYNFDEKIYYLFKCYPGNINYIHVTFKKDKTVAKEKLLDTVKDYLDNNCITYGGRR